MKTKVLVTNGGPHSPDDLGLATAEQITDTDPNIQEDRKIVAQRLRLEMADILSHYHRLNQQDERARLLVNEPNEPQPEYDELADLAFQDVLHVTSQSVWQQHYNKSEVQDVIKYIIAKDLAHSRHIERDWHRQKDST